MSEHAGETVEALVERVRKALHFRPLEYQQLGQEAHAALTALAARAQEAERERDELQAACDEGWYKAGKNLERADSAESALREAREALRPDLYTGVKYKLLCYRCGGLGWVGPSNHDDPKAFPCSDCEGTGLREALRRALAQPAGETAPPP